MIHDTAHELAGKTVVLNLQGTHPQIDPGDDFHVEDWWDRVAGKSWMFSDGKPAALMYAIRAGVEGLPTDDEVVYGKIGPFGHIVHVSELGAVRS